MKFIKYNLPEIILLIGYVNAIIAFFLINVSLGFLAISCCCFATVIFLVNKERR